MLSKDLEQTLNEAFIRARERRHEFMTVEHLLLALIDNVSAADVLRSCGADLAVLVAELDAFIEDNTPLLGDNDERDTTPTLGFQRCTATRGISCSIFRQKRSYRCQCSGCDLWRTRITCSLSIRKE